MKKLTKELAKVGMEIVVDWHNLADFRRRLVTKNKVYKIREVNHDTLLFLGNNDKEIHWYYHRFFIHEADKQEKFLEVIDASRIQGLALGERFKEGEYAKHPHLELINIRGYWYASSRFKEVNPEDPIIPIKEEKKEKDKFKKENELNNLLLEAQGGWDAGCCSYAIMFESGHVRYQVNDACHARLPWKYVYDEELNKKEDKPIVVSLLLKGYLRNKDVIRAAEYILYESPWKDMYINLPKREELKDAIAVNIDLSRGINEVVGAAIALRTSWEFTSFSSNFVKLIDNGAPLHEAWMMATCMSNGVLNIWQGGHHVFNTQQNIKDVAAFLKTGKFKTPGDRYDEAAKKMYMVQNAYACPANPGHESFFSLVKKFGENILKEAEGQWGAKALGYKNVHDLAIICHKINGFIQAQ